MKDLLKKLMAITVAIVMLGAVTAGAVYTDRECSLTVHLAERVAPELAREDVSVDLYKVARMSDEHYDYAAEADFAELDLAGYKDLVDNDEATPLADLTAQATALAAELEPLTTGTAKEGIVTFEGLETGLYLVLAHTIDAGEHTYTFTPVMVSLPSMERYEGEGISGGVAAEEAEAGGAERPWAGTDAYDVVIGSLKPDETPLYGDLRLTKTLDTFNRGPANFVFEVEAVRNGVTEYSDVIAMTFEGPGTHSAIIEQKIPLGSDVTVTEVYSGAGYELIGQRAQTVHLGWAVDEEHEWVLDADGQPTMVTAEEVTFRNTYVGSPLTGTSVENRFTKDGETWIWQGIHSDGRVQTHE